MGTELMEKTTLVVCFQGQGPPEEPLHDEAIGRRSCRYKAAHSGWDSSGWGPSATCYFTDVYQSSRMVAGTLGPGRKAQGAEGGALREEAAAAGHPETVSGWFGERRLRSSNPQTGCGQARAFLLHGGSGPQGTVTPTRVPP